METMGPQLRINKKCRRVDISMQANRSLGRAVLQRPLHMAQQCRPMAAAQAHSTANHLPHLDPQLRHSYMRSPFSGMDGLFTQTHKDMGFASCNFPHFVFRVARLVLLLLLLLYSIAVE